MLRPLVVLLLLSAGCAESAPFRTAGLDPAAYRLEPAEASLLLGIAVESLLDEPLVARRLAYEVRLDGQAVALGTTAVGEPSGVQIPPGGEARIELPLTLSRRQLPSAVALELARGASIPVEVEGHLLAWREGRAAPLEVSFEVGAELTPAP